MDKQITTNKMALIGFILGLISILFGFMGIIPILAVVFSIMGLIQLSKKKSEERGQWMSIVGLILGIIYLFVYLNAYGYF